MSIDCNGNPFPPFGVDFRGRSIIIGIGASTGGTEAVLTVLRRLPADTPGIVVVQHMPPEGDFTEKYAERLDSLCQMKVCVGRHGDEIISGCAYLAPADHHTRIVENSGKYILVCTQDGKISHHRPSVDALFYSMAENVRCSMVGIIMTGMGDDGAKGLLAMRRKGAFTIGQDEASSAIYGMPKEAFRIGAVAHQVPCEGIAAILYQHLQGFRY